MNYDEFLDELRKLDARNLLWKYLEAKTGENQAIENLHPQQIRKIEEAINDALKSLQVKIENYD